MSTLLLTHPIFVEHDNGPGHPERPDRMRALDRVFSHELFSDLVREEAPLRDDVEENILRAHPAHYLAELKASVPKPGQPSKHLDPDTVMSPHSWEPAMRAVGAGLAAVDAVMDQASAVKNAFCQVRPCGHHAEADKAMGFCFFSNVAIAGLYAKETYGLDRVAVVDFDVHHGNGTQDIYWAQKDMFFASTHQMPLFPGSGAVSETGVGNICNAPLRSGDGGEAFKDAFESRVIPALRSFSPDLVLISAGFDAHAADPLASLELVEADFIWATQVLSDVADKHCDGRIVSMLEGGYDLNALAKSCAVHVHGLMQAGS
ncbi:MAG: histone deacetylase family protein [Pseudomonadota bacterium]